jgi:HEPN domain-containing protein
MKRSHEHARTLLQKAQDDQYVFNRLADDSAAPLWSLGFHAQQAIEKAIKAVLTVNAVEYPRTHNLAMLLQLLQLQAVPLPPGAEDLPGLTPFGVVFRYDDTMEDEEIVLDRQWTSACIERTIMWAEAIIVKAEQDH